MYSDTGLNAPAMSWKHVLRKFEQLSRGRITPEQGRGIADAVRALDTIRVSDLTRLLASVGGPGTRSDAAGPTAGD